MEVYDELFKAVINVISPNYFDLHLINQPLTRVAKAPFGPRGSKKVG